MESTQRILRDKDILKASRLFGIEEATLRQLNDLTLLNADYIRACLIKSDYDYLVRGLKYLSMEHKGKYEFPEVMAAITKEYGIKPSELNAIVHGTHSSKMWFCKRCGIRITKTMFERSGGLCSQCFADTINL